MEKTIIRALTWPLWVLFAWGMLNWIGWLYESSDPEHWGDKWFYYAIGIMSFALLIPASVREFFRGPAPKPQVFESTTEVKKPLGG